MALLLDQGNDQTLISKYLPPRHHMTQQFDTVFIATATSYRDLGGVMIKVLRMLHQSMLSVLANQQQRIPCLNKWQTTIHWLELWRVENHQTDYIDTDGHSKGA